MAAKSEFYPGVEEGVLIWKLAQPINKSLAQTGMSRADLIFLEVEHAGLSFQVHVFFNNNLVNARTSRVKSNGYAGSFSVFGHGGCAGAPGHCDPRLQTREKGDLRPELPLKPTTIVLPVTEALLHAINGDKQKLGSVTLVPIVCPPRKEDYKLSSEALVFEEISFRIYA